MHAPMSLKANAKLIQPCFLEMVTKISISTKAVGSTAEWPGMFPSYFPKDLFAEGSFPVKYSNHSILSALS